VLQELQVAKTNLSSTRRKKISAEDARTSAQTIGYSGLGIVILIGLLLLVPDCISLIIHLKDAVSGKGKDK
jgi:hypothetical protein